MKSILIKDTTKEERIALIKEWIPDEDGFLMRMDYMIVTLIYGICMTTILRVSGRFQR